ncbi:hypothetical protein D3C81_881150 [compost metagenome]
MFINLSHDNVRSLYTNPHIDLIVIHLEAAFLQDLGEPGRSISSRSNHDQVGFMGLAAPKGNSANAQPACFIFGRNNIFNFRFERHINTCSQILIDGLQNLQILLRTQMPYLCPQQLESGGIAALFNPPNRVRHWISHVRRCAVLQIDTVYIFNQFEYLGGSEIISHPSAKFGGNIELPITICACSPEACSYRASGQTACEFFLARSRRTQLDLLFEDRTAPLINIMALVDQQHLPVRGLEAQFITCEYPCRTGTYDDYIIFTHGSS